MRDDLDPRIVTLLGRHKKASQPVARLPNVRQVYGRGRYISPKLTELIVLVARNADIHPEAISRGVKTLTLVNARFAVANLAEEFAPRLSSNAIDDGMLRGPGMTRWYRERHRDRIELYPQSYGGLYERCRAELLSGGRP